MAKNRPKKNTHNNFESLNKKNKENKIKHIDLLEDIDENWEAGPFIKKKLSERVVQQKRTDLPSGWKKIE